MSCCLSGDALESLKRSREIDKILKKHHVQLRRELKLLLLGAGESGKSTIVKQMKIIHGDGYSEEERREFVPLIHQNLITSMKAMLEAMQYMGLRLDDETLVEPAAKFLDDVRDLLERAPIDLFKLLWRDNGIKAVYRRRREYQLSDSTAYYMDALGRIDDPKFIPTAQDVLRARVPTTGIIEYTFNLRKVVFRMVDVGGQRSQRRKWIHCFEDVTSLIFIVALSEYDQTLLESETTNRMVESISLFRHIVRERWFRNTSVILFLNKVDILKEKILSSNVAQYFPAFDGNSKDLGEVEAFFLSMFQREKSHLYPHFTCATDTDNIKFVFESVEETIMQTHLQDYHIA